MDSVISVRLNEEERKIFEEYSMIHKEDMGTVIKRLALERIYDELDLNIVSGFEEKLMDGRVTVRPYEELVKDMDL